MKRAWIFLLSLGIFVVGLANILLAEDFQLFDGGTITEQELLQTEKTVLFFWASWCPHCRTEIERLTKTMDLFQKNNVKLYCVNTGERRGVIESMKKKYNFTCPIVVDTGSLSSKYQVYGIPTYVILHNQKRLATTHAADLDYITQVYADETDDD